MKRVHVVAAVIRGQDDKEQGCVLIAKRPDHVHQGGKWEFPGGKVETDEKVEVALVRELQEELGITPTKYSPLIQIHHDYADKSVFLDVWDVHAFSGEPHGAEGQLVEWVVAGQLNEYEFPAANVPIVNAAMLPSLYWITPEPGNDVSAFLTLVEQRLEQGVKLLQLRVKQTISPGDLRSLAQKVTDLCEQYHAKILLNSATLLGFKTAVNVDGADTLAVEEIRQCFHGVHLTSEYLNNESPKALYDLVEVLQLPLAASCHNLEELNQAHHLKCQFVTLSPIKSTDSHPEALPLEPGCALDWVKHAKLPVYALGGMEHSDIERYKSLGFQGVAGIRLKDMK